MNITQITVSYGATQSLPEYSNVKPSLTITAILEKGEDVAVIEAQLWEHAKDAVHEQIDQALEANDKPAKYSTEPRFQIARTYSGYSARGEPALPKIVVVLPDEVDLDKRFGNIGYRESQNLRYAHAMRTAATIAQGSDYTLIDCSDGDLSRLDAVLPPKPAEEAQPAQQHPVDVTDLEESDMDFDTENDDDDE